MFHALNSPDHSSDESDSGDSTNNGSESDSQNPPAELKDGTVHDKYRAALNYYASSNFKEAKDLLQLLVNDKIFVNIAKTKPTAKQSLKQLYFGVLKNLAAIYADEKNSQLAVDYYLKAIDISKSDVVVFYRLGAEACKSEQFSLARYAFEEGLKLSPEHWLCLDKLIAVLYVVGDYNQCLLRIKQAFEKNAKYVRGLVLIDEIHYRAPFFIERSKKLFEEFSLGTYSDKEAKEILDRLNALSDRFVINSRPKPPPIIKPKTKLTNLSWISLGEAIHKVYDEFESENIPVCSFVDLSEWIEAVYDKEEQVSFEEPKSVQQPLVDSEVSTPVVENHVDFASAITFDSTMDSVVSESDNDAKSVAATSTTSGGDVGFDESQHCPSSAPSDVETPPASTVPLRRTTKGSPRGRRPKARSLISEAKRRSTRLIPGFYMEDPEAFGPLTTKPVSLKDQLHSYLPDKLKSTDESSEDDINCINNTLAEENFQDCQVLDEKGTPEEILELLKSLDKFCFTYLLWEFVKKFCHKWNFKWSDEFCTVYLKCSTRWMRHAQYSTPVANDDPPLEYLRDLALVRLSAVELEFKLQPSQILDESNFLVENLSQMSLYKSLYGPEWSIFSARVAFYRAKRAEYCKNFVAAKSFLEKCDFWLNLYDLDENFTIFLPNTNEKICKVNLERKFNTLDKRCVLNSVESYFEKGDYQSVIDVLSPKIDNDTVGSKEKYERCKLLTKSYLALKDYKSLSESSIDLLRMALETYRRLDFVDKYDWWKNFDEIFNIIDISVQNYPIFVDSKLKSLKNFAETLIELILCCLDYASGSQRQKDIIPTSCWIYPWILLYKLCKTLERDSLNEDLYLKTWYSTGDSHNVVLATKSLMILHRAHEELGKIGLCMLNEGQLLLTVAEELMTSLRHPVVAKNLTSSANDDTLNCAEQCFYCLYNYPRKRSRCLVEHLAKNVNLTWERAQLVFDFVRPEKPPEFDDQPHNCISAETVHLLHRIEALLPDHLKPDQFHHMLEDYIEGRCPNLSTDHHLADAPIVKDIYHLLADYYGKAKDKDLKKVCLYYEYDLCASNDRIDSWAGLALHKGTIVDQILNSLDLKYDDDGLAYVNTLASPALFCYRKATSLIADHVVLMVEHGSLAYALHSYVQRVIKRRFTKGNIDPTVKKIAEDYLLEARNAFEIASQVPRIIPELEFKEKWVQFYMLGKISEKLSEKPSKVLSYYHQAAYFLHMDGAKYPSRIQYNMGHNAFDALEIFYRVHSSALKWLKRKFLKDYNDLVVVWKYLHMFSLSPFTDHQVHHGRASAVSIEKRSVNRGRLFINPDVTQVVDDLVKVIELNEFDSAYPVTMVDMSVATDEVQQCVDSLVTKVDEECRRHLRRQIVQWSIEAMQICIKRCNHCPHYKAYCTLASWYFANTDPDKSRRILFGPVDFHTPPLFVNLKGQNLFEGIWVIPSDDVSRAGSLAAHLYNAVRLMEKILKKLCDYDRLCDLSLLLIRKPGTAKSKYLKECDREELAVLVLKSAELVLKNEFKKTNSSRKQQENICLRAYQCFTDMNRPQTNVSYHRNQWSEIIKWLYASYSGIECLDLSVALNFFQSLLMKRKEEMKKTYKSTNKTIGPVVHQTNGQVVVHQTTNQSPVVKRASVVPKVVENVSHRNSPQVSSSTKRVEPRNDSSSDVEIITVSDSSSKSSNDVTIVKEISHSQPNIQSLKRPSNANASPNTPLKRARPQFSPQQTSFSNVSSRYPPSSSQQQPTVKQLLQQIARRQQQQQVETSSQAAVNQMLEMAHRQSQQPVMAHRQSQQPVSLPSQLNQTFFPSYPADIHSFLDSTYLLNTMMLNNAAVAAAANINSQFFPAGLQYGLHNLQEPTAPAVSRKPETGEEKKRHQIAKKSIPPSSGL